MAASFIKIFYIYVLIGIFQQFYRIRHAKIEKDLSHLILLIKNIIIIDLN